MKNPFHVFGFGLALFYLAFNIYIALWLAFRLALGPKGRFAVYEAALLLSAFYPAVRTFASGHFGGATDCALWLALFGFGTSFVFFWVLLVCDLGLLALSALGSGWTRSRPAAITVLALAAGFVALAAWHGAEIPRPKRVEVTIKNLPKELDGFTIAQISDLHLGRMIKLERLEKIAGIINTQRPDLLVITGDFAESREPMPDGTCGVIKGIYARYGKAAVLGNHDLFTGGTALAEFLEDCGVKVLRGTAYEPVPGLVVAGVDDLRRKDGAAVRKLAAVLDRSKPLIFLSHQPQGFDEITAAGAGLVLSGHTHKGQIFPFGPLERHMFKYFYGLYKAGNFSVYVTSGAGAWGPPLRLFADAELPLLVLRSGK
jgi:hypothetical protein